MNLGTPEQPYAQIHIGPVVGVCVCVCVCVCKRVSEYTLKCYSNIKQSQNQENKHF